MTAMGRKGLVQGYFMLNIKAVTEIALAAGRALSANCKDINSPFIHGYPWNCCELVAVHLGSVLRNANPHKEVQIVRAYNSSTDGLHYWVEMDNLVLDLTAHQFDEFWEPLVCKKPSPLENRFPDIERISSSDAACDARFEINPQIECILAAFGKQP
ncbi:hypothetical protein [Pacificibacter sp. AS14]|uniref:hypothetical protein n=1 Tax=Pacificibacter sp. AS14 TaxID=3135785 RepID=UPI00317D9CCC